jgi:hypothetical protein
MSLETLIESLKKKSLTPVTPCNLLEVTEKILNNQISNPCNPCNPKNNDSQSIFADIEAIAVRKRETLIDLPG